MQFTLSFIAIGMLFILAVLDFRHTQHKPPEPSLRDAPLSNDALLRHIKLMEPSLSVRGQARPRLPRGLKQNLTKLQKSLRRLPEKKILPAAQTLHDNLRRIEQLYMSAAFDLRGQCKLARTKGGRLRIMKPALEMVAHSNGLVTKELCVQCLNAYYEVCPLTQRELFAFPLMLRIALLSLMGEMLLLVCSLQRDVAAAEKTAALLNRKGSVRQSALKNRSAAFWERLLAALKEAEDTRGAAFLLKQLAHQDSDASCLVQAEHSRQAEHQQLVSNAMISLIAIEQLPWQEILEAINPIHLTLLKDAAETYPKMDFESRQYYCGRVQRLAGQCRVPESVLAEAACRLTKEGKQDGVHNHVGYYLTEAEGEQALKNHLHASRPFFALRLFIKKHVTALYRLSLFLWALLGIFALYRFHVPFLMGLFSLPLSAQLARRFWRYVARKRLPPRFLPRVQLDQLTEETRCLVVIPTLITAPSQALAMARRLSVAYHANPDSHLHFMLLGDFADSDTKAAPDDDAIILAGKAAIDALSRDIPKSVFYYLHRGRTFNPKQGRYIGRERKRGALEMLNRYLLGRESTDPIAFSNVDLNSLAHRYRYVITLDSDTVLPPGAARRLIGTISHPLHVRRRSGGKMRGMSLIVPVVEITARAVTTPIAYLWSGSGGTDPYNHHISNLYQDMACRGSFSGKGIYTPDTFLDESEGRIRKNSILSHDLLEGALTGSAISGDITLYDTPVKSVSGFFKRLHRWTRGDWQLLPWLLPFVPGTAEKNPLDGFSRHKIWDNLLRSLVPAVRLMLLFFSVHFRDPFFFALALFAPAKENGPLFISRLAFLPLEAYTLCDAIARTLHRLLISHRHMLDWVTAAQSEHLPSDERFEAFIQYACAGLMGLTSLLALPFGWVGLPVAALFALAPSCQKALNGDIQEKAPLGDEDTLQAIDLAAQTFSFFDALVTEKSHFLPPDNLQIYPDKGIATRTSPTNIGLYLLALVATYELQLIDANELGRRAAKTIDTLQGLEKWQGHFYNWYDTITLLPLPPRFISAVDSGNLAACLITVAQALRTLAPQMDAVFHPLSKQLDALAEEMDFAALFDPVAQLFHIGFDTGTNKLTPGHYDLLASESRLLSFTAILLGKVPSRHWWRLGRTLVKKRHTALISWSGTLFEYFMPHILLPYVRGTLMHETATAAFFLHVGHKKHGVFGVSESGYYAFDASLNYQYKAFGLPLLALSGETRAEVIAPYASLLAFPLFPRRVSDNLRQMVFNKWQSSFGLYEAVDFDSRRVGQKAFEIVKSHMAHHQAMILCALCNGLKDNALQKYFSALPKAIAYAPLLEERTPYFRYKIKLFKPPQEKEAPPPPAPRDAESDALPIDAHLIYGGGTTLMVDGIGNGFMKTDGIMLSRFRESADIPSGIRFYIRDAALGTLYSLTGKSLAEETRFFVGKAAFNRRFDLFESSLTAYINPIDGAVLHAIELINLSDMALELELCDYFELCLNGQKADVIHPAFGDLFIETARLSKTALTACRRPKDGSVACRILTHALIGDADITHAVLQTDRGAFIGRNGNAESPAHLQADISHCADFYGAPITPCMSIRGQFSLPPRGKARFVYVTCYIEEKKLPPPLVLERYRNLPETLRVIELSQLQGQVTLKHLALDNASCHLYSRMTGALLYARDHSLPFPLELGLRGLFALSISGDLPIMTVFIQKREHMGLLKNALAAHSLYAMQGVWTDLAAVVDEALYTAAIHLKSLSFRPESVHIFRHDALSPAQLTLLGSVARLSFRGEEGSLKAQFALLIRKKKEPLALPKQKEAPPLPPLSRLYFNGFGGFMEADGDYVIDTTGGVSTPAPFSNLLCTKSFGNLVTESGFGFTYYKNSHFGRITPFYNDPVSCRSGERILLHDKESDTVFSPTLMPYGQSLNHRCTHSFGVTTYFSVGLGFECTLTVFSDETYPVSVRQLRVKNTEPKTRQLRITHEADFDMDGAPFVSVKHDAYLRLATQPDFDGIAFLAALAPHYFNKEHILKPGQQVTVAFLLGAGETTEKINECIDSFTREGITARLRGTKSAWLARLGKITFSLPDEKLNLFMNKWLPYQTLTSRLYARAGFYQAGGAIGFRDQLQDMLLLTHTDPAKVKAHLLDCAAHQYEEGDVQHWWHPPNQGVRTRVSDDLLFLPYITARYVKCTGDAAILNETAPYLSAPPLLDSEADRYHSPTTTDYRETLLEHCLKAIRHVALSERGLPLMKGGDWNDGMNLVGGESVWLALFMATVLKDFAPFCDLHNHQALLSLRDTLLRAVDAHAWDGDWYLRAFYSHGEPLGSQGGSSCQIDSLSQSFAVLSGINRERAARGMDAAYHRLFLKDIGVMQLLSPPFEPADRAGYIAGYLPGIRENGGQYTHAVPWFIWAMKELNRKDRAYELLEAVLPINHSLDKKSALRYRLEPYFLAGDIYTNKKQYGRGGWSMYTGSAAWLYTVVLEQLLGFTKTGDQLTLKPFVPDAWTDFSLTLAFGQSTWHITAARDTPYAILDGEKLIGGVLTLTDDRRIHTARFPIA